MEFLLTNDGMAEAMLSAEAELKENYPDDGRLRARLLFALEDALLNWQSSCEGKTFSLSFGKRWGQRRIELALKGEAWNPLLLPEADDDLPDDWTQTILANMNLAPVYSYQNGVNRVVFRLPLRPLHPIAKIAGAILGGAAAGLLLQNTCSPETVALISQALVAPFCSAYLGLLMTIAIPAMFLLVIFGNCTFDFGRFSVYASFCMDAGAYHRWQLCNSNGGLSGMVLFQVCGAADGACQEADACLSPGSFDGFKYGCFSHHP